MFKCLHCNKIANYSTLNPYCCGNPNYGSLEILDLDFSCPFGTILGEGNTPVVKLNYLENIFGIQNVWSKNEFQNPSGSFKDRESAFVFSKLHKRGIKSAAIASSGNAAISACLYANYFGIKLSCYLSSNSCTKKQAILKSLGAELNLVNGYYKDVYEHLVSTSDLVNITSGQFGFAASEAYLIENGVQTLIHYPIPSHKQICYKEFNDLSLPLTEQVHNEELSLPISPVITSDDLNKIVNLINDWK